MKIYEIAQNENLSHTGTATAKSARKKGLEPGTEEWFKHWFSLPYMIPKKSRVAEASYAGNIGIMELIKFKQTAPPAIKKLLDYLIDAGRGREAWKIIQQHTKTKLKGKQFEAGVSPARPRLGLTEGAYTHSQYLAEQQLLENFLDSIKQYIGGKANQSIQDVQNTITNYKEAGLLIKEILETDELFEVVVVQVNKQLRLGLDTLAANRQQNNLLYTAWQKLRPMFNRIRQASGWLGLIGKLIFVGIIKFLNNGVETIASEVAVDEMYDKVSAFVGKMIKSTEQITMPWFVNTLKAFKVLDEYFFETLSYIRQKLRSVQIKTTGEPVQEANDGNDDEVFHFGNKSWDVKRGYQLVKQHNIQPEMLPVQNGLAKFLGFTRTNPEWAKNAHLEDPVLLIDTGKGVMVIDGYHRIKRAKDEGVEELPGYILSQEMSDEIEIVSEDSDMDDELSATLTRWKQQDADIVALDTQIEKLMTHYKALKSKDTPREELAPIMDKLVSMIDKQEKLLKKQRDRLKSGLGKEIDGNIVYLGEGPLGKALGTAAVAGAVGLAGHGAYKTVDQLSNIDTNQPAKVAQAPAQAKQDLSTIDAKAQKSAADQEKKAQKSVNEYTPITGKKNEMILAKVAQQHGIEGVELAAFMAQMAHESAGFGDMVENNPNVERYAKLKSLGNKSMNDAKRFIGRGFIQLTGRWNYNHFGKKIGMDLTSTWSAAHQAADPKIAALIAVEFWKSRVQPNVTDFADVAEVTKPINPSLNGLDDRVNKFNKIANHMGIDV